MKNPILEFIGGLTTLIIVVLLSIIVGLLSAWIVFDVSKLFALAFVVGLGFKKVYGLFLVINIIKFKKDTEDTSKQSFSEKLLNGFLTCIENTLILLLAWSSCYFAHWLFFTL